MFNDLTNSQEHTEGDIPLQDTICVDDVPTQNDRLDQQKVDFQVQYNIF